MHSLITFDPGYSKKNALGWARFSDYSLTGAGIVRPDGDFYAMANAAVTAAQDCWQGEVHTRAIIEVPEVYPGVQDADPNDLLPLSELAGYVGYACRQIDYPVERVVPKTWKRQVPKDIMTNRITKRLGPAEFSLIAKIKPVGLRHNAIDAVGIGLWKLGRL